MTLLTIVSKKAPASCNQETGAFFMQRKGFEPSRRRRHTDLNRARLPFRHLCVLTDCKEKAVECQPHEVRRMGLEPTRHCWHKILSLARLPIPTSPQRQLSYHRHYDYARTFFDVCGHCEYTQNMVRLWHLICRGLRHLGQLHDESVSHTLRGKYDRRQS